ncbi:MAG TPA: vWA domain-containing protein, partial [Polyangia bacterium]|nr:vWA domain-containing protein [Polyangia bacterium]
GDVGISGGNCGQASVPIKATPPDVLIIQDKSGSMDEDDNGRNSGSANSKWTQMKAALKQVVMANDTQINWGLKFFSDDNHCGAAAAPVVTIGTGNYGAISTAIDGTGPNGYTPTRDAVTTGAAYLSGVKDSNNKFILLATDGLPNCPAGCAAMSNPSNMCQTTDNPGEDQATTQAIADALTKGIKTFVIGVGDVAVAQNTLNNFAMAGGLPQKGGATSYYAATDATALENALQALIGAVFSCTVSLSTAPSGFTNVAVSAVDTATSKPVEIMQDPTNGWSYDANKQNIVLKGTACDNLKNGVYKDLNFIYACEGTVICIDRNPDGSCSDHPM